MPLSRQPAAGPLIAVCLCLCGLFLLLVASSFVTIDHLKSVFLANRAGAFAQVKAGGFAPSTPTGVPPASLALRGTRALVPRSADDAGGTPVGGPGGETPWPALRPIDVMLAAAAVACAAAAAVLEWRHRALQRFFAAERPALLWLFFAVLMLWYGHAILLPGLIVTGDGGAHVARVNHLAMALRDGSSLYWDNSFYGGGLLLQFTGPLFHWLATAATLAIGDATEGVKLTAFAARVLAGTFMLLYLRRAGLGGAAAFFGGACFAGSFFVSYLMSIRSTFPQIVNLVAIAALLYYSECVMARPRIGGAAWLGLCLAAIAMVGNHPPTALMACPLLAAYVSIRLATHHGPQPMRALLAAVPVIAIGSVYFLVPFAVEKSWMAQDGQGQALLGLAWPDAKMLLDGIAWGKTGTGAVYAAYFGTVMLALAAAGLLLRRQASARATAAARLWPACALVAVASLFLTGSFVRPTVFTFTLLCAAAAAAAHMLFAAFPGATYLPLLLFAAFTLDNAAAPLQAYTRRDMAALEQAGVALADRARGERVLLVSGDAMRGGITVSLGPDASPLQYARVRSLQGPHKLDATRAHNAMMATLVLAEADLSRTGTLGPTASLLLAQYDVAWMAGFSGAVPGLPARVQATLNDPVIGRYAAIPGATPILAASRLEHIDQPASFAGRAFWRDDFRAPDETVAAAGSLHDVVAMANRMGIDLAHRTAAAILVASAPQGAAWQLPPGPAPTVGIDRFEVSAGTLRLALHADRAGLLRLAQPSFPGTRVTRNGQAVPSIGDVFDMLVVPIIAGQNDIVVTVHPSRLRLACLAITGAAVAILAGLLLACAVARWRRTKRC